MDPLVYHSDALDVEVPKGHEANLLFRQRLIRMAVGDRGAQRDLWAMCSRDVLFYANAFAFTYDPRRIGKTTIPFVTYPCQDDAIRTLQKAVWGGSDIVIEKSRDMGASWITLLVFDWFWRFVEGSSFLLGSWKEDLVDKEGDPKSLFSKLDFLNDHMPMWLKPRYKRVKLHYINLDIGSTIDGEATTPDFARGHRRTAICFDEFASVPNGFQMLSSTGDAADCRIFMSTPKGKGNAFYDRVILAESGEIPKIRLHWTQHPIKSIGLYYDADNKPRSPWYDRECKRRGDLAEIAQEIDINYHGSGFPFFDGRTLERLLEKVAPPDQMGMLDYTDAGRPAGWHFDFNGPMRLWFTGEPLQDRRYAVGADVSTGTGASPSTLSVVDLKTNHKVMEYASAMVDPCEFAKLAVAVARWFKGRSEDGALLIWEANGAGKIMGKEVIRLGYGNIYYSQEESKVTPRTTDIPGWHSTKNTKMLLLAEYRTALATGRFYNPSREALRECEYYVYTGDGGVIHSLGDASQDPSGAKDNHGDKVIADALASKMTVVNPQEDRVEAEVNPGSFLYRQKNRAVVAAGSW